MFQRFGNSIVKFDPPKVKMTKTQYKYKKHGKLQHDNFIKLTRIIKLGVKKTEAGRSK